MPKRKLPPGIPPPWKHQAKTVKALMRNDGFFDMSDPGTGKTRPAIDHFAKRGGRMLVLAVKSNLEVVWRDEILKWQPGIVPVVAYAENRMDAFKSNYADVLITNTDAVTWIQAQGAAWFKKLGITKIVVDESTYFKNPQAARTKAAMWVASQPSVQYVETMSGTPNPLTILEMWSQMMLVDGGARLGNSYYRFRSSVCAPTKVRVAGGREITKWDDLPDAEQAVFGLLQPVSIRHKFEECTDIPPNKVTYRDVPLPPKLRADYDQLEAAAILEHARDPIVGVNAAVLYGKLLQLCSGAVYSRDDRYRVFDRSRYELVADLVDERPHASISFFLWQHQKIALSEELTKRGVSFAVLDGTVTKKGARTQAVNDFQNGRLKHLIIHPKTGAHGLTLTTGRTAIWCSPVPSPELFKQGGHRIHRGGQVHKTETICIRAPRTLEMNVYESMMKRKGRMDNFLDLIAGTR